MKNWILTGTKTYNLCTNNIHFEIFKIKFQFIKNYLIDK